MADRTLLRLSVALLFIGGVGYEIVSLFHVAGANNHVAAFTALANSSVWTGVHLGQFLATAVVTAGLLVLFYGLNITAGMPMLVNRLGAASLVASLALAGVVYAVDGVALKQAADAWLRAPAAEKAARFATAEGIRWLEWGIRSYDSFAVGLALVLFAAAIVWTARIPRPIGYLMGATGLANFVLGWFTSTEGFSPTTGAVFNLAALSQLAWMIWLLIVAWRMQPSVPVPVRAASS
jgi:hypothetical protein